MKPIRMQNPPHPGEILRELCLVPLNLSVTDAAASLDVSRNTLSAILNGRAGISPEMAVRLSMRSTRRPRAGCINRCNTISGMRSNRGSSCEFGSSRPRRPNPRCPGHN